MKLLDLNLVFLDLQTTGASPAKGAPLEVAWALGSAHAGNPQATSKYLLKQPDDQPLPKKIQQLTGITDSDMEQAVPCRQVIQELHEAVGKACKQGFVIHFAQFERPFLRQMFDNYDETFQTICTHQISTRLFPNLPSRGIRGLAGYLGFPLDECKRADTHVSATFSIWKHLCEILQQKDVHTWDELQTWLTQSPKVKRTKYEYPLERGIRLSMPDCPGIYKMISSRGDVLYVGKATSLKHRVNSYFRGNKHRDPKKLEMLTQAWDIKIETCATVVEACLREVQEIKRLSPPYNIAMNAGVRPLLFYSHDFASCASEQSAEHLLGPFRSEIVLDSFLRLIESVRTDIWDPHIFFRDVDPATMEDAFDLFLKECGHRRSLFDNPRDLLALGMWMLRKAQEAALEEEPALEEESEEETPDDEVELSAEEVAAKFGRVLIHSASAYLLSRKLTRLLNARVTFTENGKTGTIDLQYGQDPLNPWAHADTDTFDLLRVLHTEVCRLRKAGEQVIISSAPSRGASSSDNYILGAACGFLRFRSCHFQ